MKTLIVTNAIIYLLVSLMLYILFVKNYKASIKAIKKNKTKNDFISVVVSYHNEEKYINVTLPSLLNQTYKHYELILIDDASTDGTLKLLKYWQKKYSNKIRITSVTFKDKKKLSKKVS